MYLCEIPGCGRSCTIRSRIKSGEFVGKKACPLCKSKLEPKFKERKPIKKGLSEKALQKRRAERAGLPEYYETGIALLKQNPFCQNCGKKILTGVLPVNNICHILSKRKYKSVSANPYNRVFLCSSKDNPTTGKGCHEDFDSKINDRPLMPVFQTVILLYASFKEDVLEQGKEREILENYS